MWLPREHFTTSPVLCRLSDRASTAIPGLYFIVTFICKGCQSGPGSQEPCCWAFCSTHTGTHSPRDTQRTPRPTQSCTCHGRTDSGPEDQGAPHTRMFRRCSFIGTQQGMASLVPTDTPCYTQQHSSVTHRPGEPVLKPRVPQPGLYQVGLQGPSSQPLGPLEDQGTKS